jgi:hypothetical protein
MSFMLGSFANGLFGGAGAVARLYGMYQGLQQTQAQLDAGDAVKAAMQDQQNTEGMESAVDNLRSQYGDPSDPNSSSSGGSSDNSSGTSPDPNAPIKQDAIQLALDKATGANTAQISKDSSKLSSDQAAAGGGKAAADVNKATPPKSAKGAVDTDRDARISAVVDGLRYANSSLTNPADSDLGAITAGTNAVHAAAPAAPAPSSTVDLSQAQRTGQAPLPVVQSPTNPLNPQPISTAQPTNVQGMPPGLVSSSPALMTTYDVPGSYAQPAPQPENPNSGYNLNNHIAGYQSTGTTPPPGNIAAGARTPQGALQTQQQAQPQPQTAPAPGTAPAQPAQPAQAQPTGPASLGSRILSAITPIGTAQAAETAPQQPSAPAPAPAPAPAAPQGGLQTGAQPAPNPAGPPQNAAQLGVPPPAPAIQTTTPAQPTGSPSQAPAKTQAGPVATSAPVAPNQQGPSVQSESTPTTVVKPPIDPRPLMALKEQRPDQYAMVTQIANEHGVSPVALAAHWYTENRLKENWTQGKAGEVGALQIMPGTINVVDPKHQYDPSTLSGSLNLAALVQANNDRLFGQDSPGSMAAYQSGPGIVKQLSDPTFWQNGGMKDHPNLAHYLGEIYPGMQLGPGNFTAGQVDWKAFVNAGVNQGPDGALRALVATGPKGMGMTDLWRNAETALISAAAARGDYAGMMHARDFVLQMSQQGATSNLMAADRSLMSGDATGAAAYLAKAHAFFPDGTFGRFGVDGKGQVWAERFDEGTGHSLGTPFQITHDGIVSQLMQTSDPAKYVQMVQEQQKTAAQLALAKQHGDYYASMADYKPQALAVREEIAARSDETRRMIAAQSNDTRLQVAGMHQQNQQREEGAVAKEVGNIYGPNSVMGSSAATPQQQASLGAQSQLYTEMRLTRGPNGRTLSSPQAQYVAGQITSGAMKIFPGAQGGYVVAKDAKSPPVAYLTHLPTGVGSAAPAQSAPQPAPQQGALNTTTPPGSTVAMGQPGNRSIIGSGAMSPIALMEGIGTNLSGRQLQQPDQATA